ncbi:MAG: DUF3800 domain-containing protein [Peptoniphilus sp.]|uniref:DUF3800 domain-containing protein n=1 Tax=Peptoniphilus sp. TaxID=1971214 RepID=UPI002A75B9AD|nr:DUF3800 domain-containing protein [Peptoniphilus sp.]MDY2987982.1 DUF3800 domain-containing protein [Peptoniphilus sp.]
MQEIFIFVDDSGTLHKNSNNDYFIYAGYLFLDKDKKEDAKRQYKSLNRRIANELQRNDELKGCNLTPKHKRALFNVMRNEYSFHVAVKISNIYTYILENKKSIVRYKDYIIKRILKYSINELIKKEKINPYEDLKINIGIDEQLTSTNGFYTLKDSVYEELKTGITNYDYGTFHKPIVFGELEVCVYYCDSKSNYLIQASDILANRIFVSYRDNRQNLRKINRHFILTLP